VISFLVYRILETLTVLCLLLFLSIRIGSDQSVSVYESKTTGIIAKGKFFHIPIFLLFISLSLSLSLIGETRVNSAAVAPDTDQTVSIPDVDRSAKLDDS
jgi:hypothetical protein